MTPRVSVVTPYRNASSYLADAISSVLAQSVSDWELLLVDDRSTDESALIAAEYSQRDGRIRTLSTAGCQRSGAAVARNVGLRVARGEFVAFLDADDLFVADKLEQEIALAERYPEASIICGAARWWHPGREQSDWIDRVRHLPLGVHPEPVLLEQLILLNRDEIPCICAILTRRAAVHDVGGFEEGLRLYEDQSLLVRLFSRYPAYLGAHLTSIYRQHEASTSAAAARSGEYDRMKIHPARVEFLGWVEQHLQMQGVTARSTARALRIARALLNRSTRGLSVSERVEYWLLLRERVTRRLALKLKHLRRSDTNTRPLPAITS